MKRVILLFLLLAVSGCGYNYERRQFIVREGQLFPVGDYRLLDVGENSITIERQVDSQGGWTLVDTEFTAGTGHSLGNNTYLRFLSLDPAKGTAQLQYSWLESVGFLVHPPF